MRPPSRERTHGLRFNITPLIDVVFLLIIFFLAASHFARSETVEPVELPQASETEDQDAPASPKRLVVTITVDQRLLVQGEEREPEMLTAMLLEGRDRHGAEFEVRFRVDRRVPYGVVEPLLIECARAGVVDVRFAVLPK